MQKKILALLDRKDAETYSSHITLEISLTKKVMNRFRLLGALVLTLPFLGGCTAANLSSWTDFGQPATIVSHAGPCVNYIAISPGRVQNSQGSDGWEFTDLRTASRQRVGGDVVITVATPSQLEAYRNAPDLAQAKSALLQIVQKDGTILPQPASCKLEG